MPVQTLAFKILENVVIDYQEKQHIGHGRKRVLPLPYIIERICYVLRTGTQWSRLHVNNGSWKTIYHYFALWSDAHLFQHAYHKFLDVYQKIYGFGVKRIVDTSFIKNIFGRDCVGSSPFDRGRKATKVSVITDEKGIPLVFTFHKGNRNDSKTLFHTLSKCPVTLDKCELYADKIYDTQNCVSILSRFGLVNRISPKKVKVTSSDNKIRIVVEHTFSWLDKFRRIIIRYDGKVSRLRSFHYLAALHILQNKMI